MKGTFYSGNYHQNRLPLKLSCGILILILVSISLADPLMPEPCDSNLSVPVFEDFYIRALHLTGTSVRIRWFIPLIIEKTYPDYYCIVYNSKSVRAGINREFEITNLTTDIFYDINVKPCVNDGSNACTIIALLMAMKVHTSKIRVRCLFKSPTKEHITQLFSEAIHKGNAIHQELFKDSPSTQNTYLTVPEAMEAGKQSLGTMAEWKSTVYYNDIQNRLYAEMSSNVIEWYTNPPCCQPNNLYMILIAHHKAVLFVVQLDMDCVLLIDSHQHSSYGAMMSQSQISKLESLCVWYSKMLCDSVGSKPDAYELSFLYFKCDKYKNKNSF